MNPPTRRDTRFHRSCPAAGQHPEWGRGDFSSCPLRAVHTGTHGRPPALADRIPLSVHMRASLLTRRYGPLLCTAALGSSDRARTAPGRRSLSCATSANAGVAQPKKCPRRACRSPGWPSTRTAAAGSGGQGVASHRPPLRATTRQHGGRARRRTHRFIEWLPRAGVWSGLRQVDGMPHKSQRTRLSTSSGSSTASRSPTRRHTGQALGRNWP